MTQRREAATALEAPTTAGRQDALAPATPFDGDMAVRDALVAGGLRGFSPDQMFPEVAA